MESSTQILGCMRMILSVINGIYYLLLLKNCMILIHSIYRRISPFFGLTDKSTSIFSSVMRKICYAISNHKFWVFKCLKNERSFITQEISLYSSKTLQLYSAYLKYTAQKFPSPQHKYIMQ